MLPARDAVASIVDTLRERGVGKTVCPSEIARRLAAGGFDWRDRMAEVHAAVDRLVKEGRVSLSWKGTPMARREGPYRIGLPG